MEGLLREILAELRELNGKVPHPYEEESSRRTDELSDAIKVRPGSPGYMPADTARGRIYNLQPLNQKLYRYDPHCRDDTNSFGDAG